MSNSENHSTLSSKGQHKEQSYTSIVLILSVFITIVSIGFVYYNSHKLNEELYKSAESQGAFIFQALVNQVSDSLYYNDVEEIRKNLQLITREEGIKRVAVFLPSGKYVIDTNQPKVPTGLIESELLDLAVNNTGYSNRAIGDSMQFVGGIYFHTKLLGGLFIELDLTAQRTVVNNTFKEQLFLAILFAILAIGLSYTIAKTLGASRQLKVIKSNLDQLIEQSPTATAIFQLNGDYLYGNPAFEEFLSHSDVHLPEESKYNIFSDENLKNDIIKKQIETGFHQQPVRIPFVQYHGEQWLNIDVFPLLNEVNKPYTAVVVLHDVSKEKYAEIEREKISAHMQHGKKLESLGMLAGRVAHDFNNLLTPIRGSSELIEHLSTDNERVTILAKKILLASERAADLCHQMLAHAGSTIISMEPINLSDEVSQLNSLFKSSLSMEVDFTQELPKELPLIDADINEIRQIILNLLINASEAIDGRGEVLLKTGVTKLKASETRLLMPTGDLPAGDYVYLEVSDNGNGMDEETLQNLFNPFFTTKVGGRGLGLSAVLGIVKQHSAGLRVNSKPGFGTKFELFFPISSSKSKPDLVQPNTLQDTFSGQILLVDDDPEVHEIGKEILNMLGFDVLTATNGKEALEIFREKGDQLQCIVLDVLMPVMNGEEALMEIRKVNSTLPVIIVTGYSSGEMIENISKHPNVTILSKPYSLNDIKQALGQIN